ncbi:hypothetical protein ACVBEF_14895 [Glaciimonas sp. GG7]
MSGIKFHALAKEILKIRQLKLRKAEREWARCCRIESKQQELYAEADAVWNEKNVSFQDDKRRLFDQLSEKRVGIIDIANVRRQEGQLHQNLTELAHKRTTAENEHAQAANVLAKANDVKTEAVRREEKFKILVAQSSRPAKLEQERIDVKKFERPFLHRRD